MRKPQLLDVVRLTSSMSAEGFEDHEARISLQAGETGTIVEVFDRPDEAYMVEFANDFGEAVAMPILTSEQFEVVVPWNAAVAEKVGT